MSVYTSIYFKKTLFKLLYILAFGYSRALFELIPVVKLIDLARHGTAFEEDAEETSSVVSSSAGNTRRSHFFIYSSACPLECCSVWCDVTVGMDMTLYFCLFFLP